MVRGSKSKGVHILVGVGGDGVERGHGDPEGCEGVRGDDGLAQHAVGGGDVCEPHALPVWCWERGLRVRGYGREGLRA